MQCDAPFQVHALFPRRLAVDPRFERVVARGKSAQSKSPLLIRHDKIWSVEHENKAAHVLMNIATKYHQPRHGKNLRWDRPFLRTIAPEIESFRRGVRKNIVVGIIQIRELHSGTHLHRQPRWKERQILLCNLFHWRRLWFRT